MKTLTRFQTELFQQYKRTQKQLRTQLKHRLAPEIVKPLIKEAFKELLDRQAKIIAYYIYKSYRSGTADAKRELKGIEIEAAAPIPDMGNVKIKLDEVSLKQMNLIFHSQLGKIGDYNANLSKTLQHQYNVLLSDNKLIKSLDTHGFTPWLEKEWQKRGIAPEVITLVKGQKTSKQMVNILELHGVKGGMHPNQVAKRLIPHINRFFGPDGVSIDNIGKTVKQFRIDADGNYGWIDHKITKIYKATPRTYSRLIARNTLRQARMDAYYDSLKGSKIVDHYISIAHMDSTTCAICASMHGQTVTKGSGPQYHGNCGCDLRPVWKKDSPLASQNKPEAFFEKQRDTHFMRANDLKRYNAKMPRGMKLKYATQLPEDAITKVMPGKIELRAIRHEMLGKPAAIKPKVPLSTVKTVETMNDKEIADELWKETAKDGKEHGYMLNDRALKVVGDKDSISLEGFGKGVYYKAYHTHPEWDCPLSPQDVALLLRKEEKREISAITKKYIYKLSKTTDTPKIEGFGSYAKAYEKMEKQADAIFRAKQHNVSNLKTLRKKALIDAAKDIAKEYHLEYTIIKR